MRNGIGIKISPNPVKDGAVIDFVVPGNGYVNIGVYNAQGQLVHKIIERSARQNGTHTMPVSLNKLVKGVYILRIEQDGRSHYTRFFKD